MRTSIVRGARTFLALLAAVSALVVAACGTSSDQPAQGTRGGNGLPDLSGTRISYLGFGGVLDDGMKSQWVAPFEKTTGARFTLDSPVDYTKLATQVRSGNVSYDITDGDPFFIDPNCGKLFEPIDVAQRSVLPQYRSKSRCGVPDYVFTTVLAFDKTKFPNGGPQTCQDFFNVQKFPGRRAFWAGYVPAAGIYECAAIALGADPAKPYSVPMEQVFAKIASIKGSLTTWDSHAQAVDGMENGDNPIYLASTRDLVQAIEKGARWGWGRFAVAGSGAFAVPKGAPHKEAAVAYLKYIMRPDVNRRLFVDVPAYSSVTGGPPPAEWPESAKKLDVTTGSLSKTASPIDWSFWAKHYDAVSQRVTAIVSG
jgi:putative spermidine/putrescine transport system substrate-binding protein